MGEMGEMCDKCGIPKNSNGECEICLARDEAAAAATFTDTMFFPQRARRSKIRRRIEAKILNKILFGLMILCAITVTIFFSAYKYKENAVNILVKASPQNQTSAYVLGQYKSINELNILKINKADIYHYVNDNRYANLIIRYYVNVEISSF